MPSPRLNHRARMTVHRFYEDFRREAPTKYRMHLVSRHFFDSFFRVFTERNDHVSVNFHELQIEMWTVWIDRCINRGYFDARMQMALLRMANPEHLDIRPFMPLELTPTVLALWFEFCAMLKGLTRLRRIKMKPWPISALVMDHLPKRLVHLSVNDVNTPLYKLPLVLETLHVDIAEQKPNYAQILRTKAKRIELDGYSCCHNVHLHKLRSCAPFHENPYLERLSVPAHLGMPRYVRGPVKIEEWREKYLWKHEATFRALKQINHGLVVETFWNTFHEEKFEDFETSRRQQTALLDNIRDLLDLAAIVGLRLEMRDITRTLELEIDSTEVAFAREFAKELGMDLADDNSVFGSFQVRDQCFTLRYAIC